jgi:hypothetical protein
MDKDGVGGKEEVEGVVEKEEGDGEGRRGSKGGGGERRRVGVELTANTWPRRDT